MRFVHMSENVFLFSMKKQSRKLMVRTLAAFEFMFMQSADVNCYYKCILFEAQTYTPLHICITNLLGKN